MKPWTALTALEKREAIARFNSKVVRSADCWGWLGAINDSGYGFMSLKDYPIRAHRLSWLIHRGEIPTGKWVLHTCDNPSCTNPQHLYIGTHSDNVRDMVERGRSCSGDKNAMRRPDVAAQHRGDQHWMKQKPERIARGQRQSHAKLTDSDVLEIHKLFAEGRISKAAIARQFGVDRTNVSQIIRGKAWTHVKAVA